MCLGGSSSPASTAPTTPTPVINAPMQSADDAAKKNAPAADDNQARKALSIPERSTTGTGLNIPA